MINRSLLLIILLCIITDFGYAQGKQVPTILSGKISTDKDSVDLRVVLWRNYITGIGPSEVEQFKIPVGKDGKFRFLLPGIDHISRIHMTDSYTSNILFDNNQLVEPGDSIFIDGIIHDEAEPYYFKAKISGRGNAKYNCLQELKAVTSRFNYNVTTYKPEEIVERSNALIKERVEILNKFRAQLNPEVYKIMKADICGNLFGQVLNLWPYRIFDSSRERINIENNSFEKIIKKLKLQEDEQVLALSPSYCKFLYERSRLQLGFKYYSRKFPVSTLYYKLRDDLKGPLREKLTAYCLLNSFEIATFFESSGIDDDVYKDAVTLIKDTLLKNSIVNHFEYLRAGREALNFELPADSSGRIVKLSDFKGKVVLIDMWAYQCTACYLFANVFHDKIYSQLKNNKDFVVVSIMLGGSSRAAYMRRLRGEGGFTYTFPEYINLFGGSGEEFGRKIEKHYDIKVFPTFLLVGKDGKIFASEFPFFTDSNSPGIEKLMSLVKSALKRN